MASSFDFEPLLTRAALELADPSLAHWAAGFASESQARAAGLLAGGELSCFSEVRAGLGSRRVSSHEAAAFQDGTFLVHLSKNNPWEASHFAQSCLDKGSELWLCLKLTLRAPAMDLTYRWCCAELREPPHHDFEPFWSACALELARAQAGAAAESPHDDAGRAALERLHALAERSILDSSERSDLSRPCLRL